jgi:uncharacterized protein
VAAGRRSQRAAEDEQLSDGQQDSDAVQEARVVDNPEQSRYEIHLGEERVGLSAYIVRPTRLIFTHTEVDEAVEGQGLGSKLARGALDDVRSRGLRITPRCPFISAYIKRHPEYQDLVVTQAAEAERS